MVMLVVATVILIQLVIVIILVIVELIQVRPRSGFAIIITMVHATRLKAIPTMGHTINIYVPIVVFRVKI